MTTLLVQDLLKEKRKDRFWKNIRFFCWFALIAALIIYIFSQSLPTSIEGTGQYVALVRLDGLIAPGRDISSDVVIPILREAFEDKNAKGILLDINSPGGTPVQASIIHDAIISFKKKYHKKVIVVGEDSLTSGAYYIAVAADKIYVNPNTITGSIGVIMKGFGFVDAIKKLGIERRVYTVGTSKDRLDPFLPQNEADLKKIEQVMEEVYQNFTQAVLNARKNKLHVEPATLFTGDFWSGQTALKLGLVDNLGNMIDALQNEFQTEKYKEFGGQPAFLRLIGGQLSSMFDNVAYGA
ncbi:MAG: hypothetical protein A3F12_03350 [Gammaproteobacteria bacterium RIFCSPHIGHO2_12_FULL_38_14]|nr:MAG: hypothetical protein A3F12_03350 [Gammaproteobacteria bacterium RIFCSPHIGHO2_12_FULL_38_14]